MRGSRWVAEKERRDFSVFTVVIILTFSFRFFFRLPYSGLKISVLLEFLNNDTNLYTSNRFMLELFEIIFKVIALFLFTFSQHFSSICHRYFILLPVFIYSLLLT